MLAGEYSVLGGDGIALCVAVAPGLELAAVPAERWELARADGVEWREGLAVPEALRFAQVAWTDAIAGHEVRPHRLTTSSPARRDERGKPGLGGSASVTALVTAAVHALAGQALDRARDRILECAIEAHRRAQGGRGSGYDVATTVLGGLVRWDRRGPTRLTWPPGLELAAAYSGRSASTPAMLERVLAIPEHERELELVALGAPVAGFATALAGGLAVDVRSAVRECHGALARWDRRRVLGIITPELARMIALAEALGVAAKVSGAGGGDSVVALDDDPERLAALARAWRVEGFTPLAIARDALGVRER
jgi:phosphomevalonate kinase